MMSVLYSIAMLAVIPPESELVAARPEFPQTPAAPMAKVIPSPTGEAITPVRVCPKRGTGTLHLASESGNRHDIREPVPVFGQTLMAGMGEPAGEVIFLPGGLEYFDPHHCNPAAQPTCGPFWGILGGRPLLPRYPVGQRYYRTHRYDLYRELDYPWHR